MDSQYKVASDLLVSSVRRLSSVRDLLGVNERSGNSYIGLGDFFSGNSLLICSRSNLIYSGFNLWFIFKFSSFFVQSVFLFSSFFFHFNRLLISKVDFNFSQRNKNLSY